MSRRRPLRRAAAPADGGAGDRRCRGAERPARRPGAELISNGVRFERYDDPSLKTDEKGIHELPDGSFAWFKDPDGNTFAVEQESKP